jgi:hypothetical protein
MIAAGIARRLGAVLGEPVPEGLSNRTWRIDLDGPAALRITQGPRGMRLSVPEEVALMEHVGDLAPTVLAHGEGWLVTRWRAAGPDDLGATLARLHTHPVPPGLRTLTPADILRALPFAGPLAILRPHVQATLDALGHVPPCLCHQDLTPGNTRGTWLLDWEYAACGDPRFDLHTVLSWVGDGRQHAFLAAYHAAGGPARPSPVVARAARLIEAHWYAVHATLPAGVLQRLAAEEP